MSKNNDYSDTEQQLRLQFNCVDLFVDVEIARGKFKQSLARALVSKHINSRYITQSELGGIQL